MQQLQLLSNSPLDYLPTRWLWSPKDTNPPPHSHESHQRKCILASISPPPQIPSQRFWMDDKSVSSCFHCQRTFGRLLNRRHHCRVCGKIFCGSCAPHKRLVKLDIPVLIAPPLGHENQPVFLDQETQSREKQLVCNTCNRMIDQINLGDKALLIFEQVRVIELWFQLHEVIGLLRVSKSWRFLVRRKLEEWRSWLYTLTRLSASECSVIWNWTSHLANHPDWALLLCRNMPSNWTPRQRHSKCMALFENIGVTKPQTLFCRLICSDYTRCRTRLRLTHVLEFIRPQPPPPSLRRESVSPSMINLLLSKVGQTSKRELLACLPILIEQLPAQGGDDVLLGFVLDACQKHHQICIVFYWWVTMFWYSSASDVSSQCFYQGVREKLKQVLPSTDQKRMALHIAFVDRIAQIAEKYGKEGGGGNGGERGGEGGGIGARIEMELKSFEGLVDLPQDTSLVFQGIVKEQCGFFESASRPLLLTFAVTDPCGPYQRIILKNDDVRKDAIAMSLISIFSNVLKRETGIDFHLLTYVVLPISRERGLVGCIPGARTLFEIKHNSRHPGLTEWLLHRNGISKVNELIERFVRSCAASCVVSYLLGVGDRHLGNIMVTPEGYMCHIDFGFLLGDDPKPFAPEIRLDEDMVKFMGNHYSRFKEYCTQIYGILRQQIGVVAAMLGYLFDCGLLKMTRAEFEAQLTTRFRTSLDTQDAKMEFNLCLDKGRTSMSTPISDFCHLYAMKGLRELLPFKLPSFPEKKSPQHLHPPVLSEPPQYEGQRSCPIPIPQPSRFFSHPSRRPLEELEEEDEDDEVE